MSYCLLFMFFLMGLVSVSFGQTITNPKEIGKGSQQRAFVHPSVMSTQADLSALKGHVVSHAAAKLGYEQLKKSKYANLERPHTPYQVVIVVPSGTSKEEDAYRDDAQAAHACALLWVITEDTRYRDKAIKIMDDWAKTFRELKVPKGLKHQLQLEAAWNVPIWVAAADIIRYYDKGKAGWKADKIAQFDSFLNIQVEIASRAQHMINNWGTSANLAIMAVASIRTIMLPMTKLWLCTGSFCPR